MSSAGFMFYFTRGNIGVAGKFIKDDYGFTNLELGWIGSAFLLGYFIFQIPGGVLGQKLGSRKMITAMLIIWGVLITHF